MGKRKMETDTLLSLMSLKNNEVDIVIYISQMI